MTHRIPSKDQHGAALIVSLMMLVILTLLAVSSINMSTVNLRVVDNMRSQMENEAAVRQAMDQIRSTTMNFGGLANADPSATTVTIAGKQIVISQRTCTAAVIVQGNELTIQPGGVGAQQNTYWEYTGSYTDPANGATSRQRQGITTQMPNGNC